MAQIDTTQIEGYEAMTAEEKVQALEGFTLPDPDLSGYVRKSVFDKTSSELATAKKALRQKQTEEETKEQEQMEELVSLRERNQELERTVAINANKAKLLSLGYTDELAESTALAVVDGDLDTVYKNQKAHQAALERRIRADLLKETPRPGAGEPPQTMTLEKLRAMSAAERFEFAHKDPEAYQALYGRK